MLRFWLLGGQRWSDPWELFVTLGGALFGTAAMFVVLFPLWETYPIVGVIEVGIIVCAGAALLSIGLRRWNRSYRKPVSRDR